MIKLFAMIVFTFFSVGMHYDKLKQLLSPTFKLVEAVDRVVGGITDEASLKTVRRL